MKQFTLKITAILISLLTIGITVQAQDFDWAKSIGSIEEDRGVGVDIDQKGNVYTIGFFSDSIDMDPSSNVFKFGTKGMSDVFVSKLNSTGAFVWAKQLGGTQSDDGKSIVVSDSGYIYLLYNFTDTIQGDPNSNSSPLVSAGNVDIGITKLDTAGNFIWAKSFGGTSNDQARFIRVDSKGNIVICGSFLGTVDFDPGAGNYSLTSKGSYDFFINKLDPSGNFLWAGASGGTNADDALAVAIDETDNIIICGEMRTTTSPIDFDFSSGALYNLTPVSVYSDGFVAKYRYNGDFVWAKQFGGKYTVRDTTEVVCDHLTIDGYGSVNIAGHYKHVVDFNPGAGIDTISNYYNPHAAFVTRLDSLGNYVWAKSFGGKQSDTHVEGITVDANNDMYVTGWFYSVVDFDPGPGVTNISSLGSWDVYITSLDVNGGFRWAKTFGGVSFDRGLDIVVDPYSGAVHTTGGYQSTADLNTDAPTQFETSFGKYDAFIHKIKKKIVGIDEIASNSKVTVYPNPTNSLISVNVSNELLGSKYVVYNVIGEELKSGTINNISTLLSIENFNSGIYFIRLTKENENQTIKIIKNN